MQTAAHNNKGQIHTFKASVLGKYTIPHAENLHFKTGKKLDGSFYLVTPKGNEQVEFIGSLSGDQKHDTHDHLPQSVQNHQHVYCQEKAADIQTY
jgi:hypothetical protein